MSRPNIRLDEEDNEYIRKIQKQLEDSGLVRPTAATAVRYALKKAAKEKK